MVPELALGIFRKVHIHIWYGLALGGRIKFSWLHWKNVDKKNVYLEKTSKHRSEKNYCSKLRKQEFTTFANGLV